MLKCDKWGVTGPLPNSLTRQVHTSDGQSTTHYPQSSHPHACRLIHLLVKDTSLSHNTAHLTACCCMAPERRLERFGVVFKFVLAIHCIELRCSHLAPSCSPAVVLQDGILDCRLRLLNRAKYAYASEHVMPAKQQQQQGRETKPEEG